VLNGHDHIYERFAPQNPSGAADQKGIQQFTVGTGGKNHTAIATIRPNSLVRNTDTYGFLKLTLHASSYDWQFVPEPGKTFSDPGTRNCFTTSSTPPTSVPGATNTPVANPTNVAPTQTAPSQATPTAAAPSDGLTFNPIADAYVTSAIPNTNYGGSQQIRFDASPVVNGYLTFKVQGLNAAVARVQLKLYANSSTSVGCKVFAVPNVAWGERAITYNTAPPLGKQIGSIGAFPGSSWITIDVTPLVTGNGTFSLAISGLNGTAVSLASRETGAKAPQLIVTTR
jgi:hypothetical protein